MVAAAPRRMAAGAGRPARPVADPFPMSDQSNLSDEEFLATNHRAIAKLRKKHPKVTDAQLANALRQSQTLMEHATSDRIIAAASLMLDERPPAE